MGEAHDAAHIHQQNNRAPLKIREYEIGARKYYMYENSATSWFAYLSKCTMALDSRQLVLILCRVAVEVVGLHLSGAHSI